ncbi:hypothetical protein [Sphingopyxis sp. PET50]|uniref:hypothetical protein n=1 Tax=Sphingopyxis sp. PET50 TaxID=2976533 RepID=UPI0021AE9895|nr:hypothetical protein [Sphingopyxis sp. PET50]
MNSFDIRISGASPESTFAASSTAIAPSSPIWWPPTPALAGLRPREDVNRSARHLRAGRGIDDAAQDEIALLGPAFRLFGGQQAQVAAVIFRIVDASRLLRVEHLGRHLVDVHGGRLIGHSILPFDCRREPAGTKWYQSRLL